MARSKASTLQALVFDGIFFTYSLFIVLYTIYFLNDFIGLSLPPMAREDLMLHMKLIGWLVLTSTIIFTVISLILKRANVYSLGAVLFSRTSMIQHAPFLKSFWGWHLLGTFALTCLVSLHVTEFSFVELFDQSGLEGAQRLFQGLANVNFALLPTAIVEVIETIFIAFLATVIAVPLAFVLAFFCAKNIMTHPIAFAFFVGLRTVMNVGRSVEPLIWAVIFSVWVGIGPFAGMLALALHTVSSLTKQYAEIIEDVALGPIEGIRATGANLVQVIWFGIVPQILLPTIAFTIFRWDINVRMATVIGLVGGGGIGNLLIKYQGQAMWPEVGCIILVIAVVVWIMDVASAYIREALR